jgi:hypothetical protein
MKERINPKLQDEWEAKLEEAGQPADIPFEHEKAAQAGVDVTPLDVANPEAISLAQKLREEDPLNVFGGFPNTLDDMISLVETLNEEWLSQGMSSREIHLVIHSSCINGHDCVTLSHNNGNRYHYNTKDIRGYTRGKLVSRLSTHKLNFVEK